jgi:uncharacterized protein YajQ (UPF0234 family)
MAAPNVVNVTTITGSTDVQSVSTSATAITTNAAASGKVYKINSLIVSNIDGTNDADVSVDLFRSSTAYYIASTITVPADATLVVISKDMGIYLQEGDAIRCLASANDDLQAICSYEIIDDA